MMGRSYGKGRNIGGRFSIPLDFGPIPNHPRDIQSDLNSGDDH